MKRIRNKALNGQYVIVKGVKFAIAAQEEMEFDDAVADRFLMLDNIEPVDDDIGASVNAVQRNTVWIANMTGNPSEPDTIKMPVFRNKHWESVDEPNPIKAARTLTFRGCLAMNYSTTKEGILKATNRKEPDIVIPPFKRVELSPVEAEHILTRSSLGTVPDAFKHSRLPLIKSRAPSKFEPDLSWQTDELIAYLHLVDEDCPLPETEEKFVAKLTKSKKETEESINQKVREYKRTIMKLLYFRLVDPKFQLPTRQEWQEYFYGKVEEDKSKTKDIENAVLAEMK